MSKRGRPSKKNLAENIQNEEVATEIKEVVEEPKQEVQVAEPAKEVVETLKQEIAKIEEKVEVKPVEVKQEAPKPEQKPVVVQYHTNCQVVAQNFAHGWITVIPKYTPITVLSDNGQQCTIMYQGRKYNIAKCYIN